MLRQLTGIALRSQAVCELQGTRWASTQLQKTMESDELPKILEGRQAFDGDLRATSGLGLGDGLTSHTAKWLQVSPPCTWYLTTRSPYTATDVILSPVLPGSTYQCRLIHPRQYRTLHLQAVSPCCQLVLARLIRKRTRAM